MLRNNILIYLSFMIIIGSWYLFGVIFFIFYLSVIKTIIYSCIITLLIIIGYLYAFPYYTKSMQQIRYSIIIQILLIFSVQLILLESIKYISLQLISIFILLATIHIIILLIILIFSDIKGEKLHLGIADIYRVVGFEKKLNILLIISVIPQFLISSHLFFILFFFQLPEFIFFIVIVIYSLYKALKSLHQCKYSYWIPFSIYSQLFESILLILFGFIFNEYTFANEGFILLPIMISAIFILYVKK